VSLQPLTGSGIQLDTVTETAPAEPGDHDKFAHYAPKDEITYALIYGVPIIALCGKQWIPSRDPKGFSVCPACKEIYEQLSENNPDDYMS
jgi:hypothetical protein